MCSTAEVITPSHQNVRKRVVLAGHSLSIVGTLKECSHHSCLGAWESKLLAARISSLLPYLQEGIQSSREFRGDSQSIPRSRQGAVQGSESSKHLQVGGDTQAERGSRTTLNPPKRAEPGFRAPSQSRQHAEHLPPALGSCAL